MDLSGHAGFGVDAAAAPDFVGGGVEVVGVEDGDCVDVTG